jgi:hypothetical protein
MSPNAAVIISCFPRCAAAAARQGKPAGGAAEKTQTPNRLYICKLLSLYINALVEKYSCFSGNFARKLPDLSGIFTAKILPLN